MTNKDSLNDLAFFGGRPAFQDAVHVGRPNTGNRMSLLERINDLLDRQWLTNNGPYVQELERRIAEKMVVRHCIATCNGTVALEIAIRALGLQGEVIIPSFTFIATAHALQWMGLTPVFCDIDPLTHTMDPHHAERLISPQTSGMIGVHLWGQPCNIDSLSAIAHRHKIKLLFDAAHAFGVSFKGRMIGNFGDAEVMSFHATKFFHTLEGGAILTNSDALAEQARLMRNFGFKGYDRVVSVGTNGKMNEISAAMGITLLEDLDNLIADNRTRYAHYRLQLSNLRGIRLFPYDETESCNYQYIVIEVDEVLAGITRDQIVTLLQAENVLARRYFYPGCHKMEPYCSRTTPVPGDLPVTETLSERIFCLPSGGSLTIDDIDRICELVRFIVSHGRELARRVPLENEREEHDA